MEDEIRIQNDFDKLEKESEINRIQSKKNKYRAVHFGKNNQFCNYKLGND